MELDSIKVKYHHFTGRFTEEAAPQPVFDTFDGYVRGPFKATKPPVLERLPGTQEVIVKHRGEAEYFPNKFEITVPQGNKYVNHPVEGWHLEVNVGTPIFERWMYVENAREKKYLRSNTSSWFEFVKPSAPELTDASVAGKTQTAQKGK